MNPSRRTSILLHVFGWLIFLSIPFLFVGREDQSGRILRLIFSYPFWLFLILFALIFYLNYYLFIPGLFFRKNYLAYGLVFTMGLLIIAWIQPFDRLVFRNENVRTQTAEAGNPPRPSPAHRHPETPPPGNPPPQRGANGPLLDVVSVVLLLMLWILGLAIRISQRGFQTERRAIQAEADKAQAELMSLKAQINPHFLFNTLNTLYTMAQLNHPACAESIMKLSNIMRYVSDEVMDDFVPLEDEIECIRQYIELQQLRLNKKTRVSLEVMPALAPAQIPPLILMTFVENIFKHGVSSHEASVIEIQIASEMGRITFFSRNRKFSPSSLDNRPGIGLDNVRKRLNYLYPDRHQLAIDTSGGYFTVKLTIEA